MAANGLYAFSRNVLIIELRNHYNVTITIPTTSATTTATATTITTLNYLFVYFSLSFVTSNTSFLVFPKDVFSETRKLEPYFLLKYNVIHSSHIFCY